MMFPVLPAICGDTSTISNISPFWRLPRAAASGW
jgi:hypothetical protein